MKKVVFIISLSLFSIFSYSQESETVYNFLRLPTSAHVAALGGDIITLSDDDATMIFHNPALISNTSDKSIVLNYMTYMEGTKTASAAFVKAFSERGTWGAMAQYMDYGEMKQTTADNIQTGTFSAKDIMIGGSMSYLLSEKISGGISAKFISSSIAGYNSMGVGVDLGINYYDSNKDLSLSIVAKNLGGQVKAYEDDFEKLPFDLQIGATKRLLNSPFRLSAAFTRLHDWKGPFKNHLQVGADLMLGETIYIAGGYNFRRNDEMAVENADEGTKSSHGAGLSFGAGLQLERFKLNLAYAKYHVSASSLMINVGYIL